MKNKIYFIAIVSLLLTSCVTTKVPYEEYIHFIDYGSAINQGVFITESPSVNFEYTPIGSFESLIKPGYSKDNSQKDKISKKKYTHDVIDNLSLIAPNEREILQKVINEIKSRGGNGIIGFRISSIASITKENASLVGGVYNSEKALTYKISGMIIKKNDL